ncbi:MAG: hypothetical protein ACXAB7_13230 [Candidatus Kariarchaeaceae archaeon]
MRNSQPGLKVGRIQNTLVKKTIKATKTSSSQSTLAKLMGLC